MGSEYVVIFVTVPNKDLGIELARYLVGNKLVACVNVIDGLRSVYYWEGRVEEDNEALLIIKTRRDRLDDVIKAIRERHPYKVPEVIALPIIGGLREYLGWIDEVVGHSK